MKDLKTFTSVVKEGKAVLSFPDVEDGTVIEVQVHIASPPQPIIEIAKSEEVYISEEVDVSEVFDVPEPIEVSKFSDMDLSDELLESLLDQGYRTPTPVQLQAIPIILDNKDLLATAQTGSGKTAAFVFPILQKLQKGDHSRKARKYPRALILAPTRELASQISESIEQYGQYTDLRTVTIYGGVSQRPQVKLLRTGVDIIVATPGRLQDLINQAAVKLDNISYFVLDEADRMLDMGFIKDIYKIVKLMPYDRQTLLFSATMPAEIRKLADDLQNNPEVLTIDSPTNPVDKVDSYVIFVEKSKKYDLLLHILEKEDIEKLLIFTRTRHGASKLEKKLSREGFLAEAIHGDKSQNARERILNDFKDDTIDILVATDVASRGLDVDDITHILNYDMSNEPEVYIHRIGRTARAGRTGKAYNFCAASERSYLFEIEKMTGEKLLRATDYPFLSTIPESVRPKKFTRKTKSGNNWGRDKKKYKSSGDSKSFKKKGGGSSKYSDKKNKKTYPKDKKEGYKQKTPTNTESKTPRAEHSASPPWAPKLKWKKGKQGGKKKPLKESQSQENQY